MRLHEAAGICLGSQAVEVIVSFHHAAVVGVGLAELQAGGGIEGPSGLVTISTLGGFRGDGFCPGAEGLERNEIACLIVAKTGWLQGGSPFSHLAPAGIVAVARGVAQRIGDGGRCIMVRIVGRSGRVARCIGHAGGAPGKIRHRGGSVAPAIRLRVDDTAGGVLARGGGGDTCRVLLRNRKTVHRHRLGGDAAGRHSTVLRPFRSFIINTPLRGSQAAFTDKNGFTLN